MTDGATGRVKHRLLRVGEPGSDGLVVPTGRPGIARIEVADTYWTRLRGMLGRRELPAGLLFVPGGSVHGVGMTRRLEVAMLVPVDEAADRTDRTAGPFRVARTAVLVPFGLVGSRRGVRCVLEAPVGSFERWGLVEGSVVTFDPPAPELAQP